MAFADRINKIIDEIAAKEFARGYFCAVAVLLREEGCATSAVKSLFQQGGSTEYADPSDIALFVQHGLM